MHVLVTGFGPFLEHRDNPSATLARAFRGRRAGGVTFGVEAPLPVAYGRGAARALGAARARRAEAVLALGLSGVADRLHLELVARNRRSPMTPDMDGRIGPSVVRPGGPATLRTALDVRRVGAALSADAIRWRVSDDAGDYVCNDLYYHLLWAGRAAAGPAYALFVHVPPTVPVARVAGPLAEGFVAALARARSGGRIPVERPSTSAVPWSTLPAW
ncbi:MAG: hypothetical protein ACFCGT_14520 [Sandaracinaceae bacterium]